MNNLLLPVYKEIFDKEFNFGSFDNRLQMQKMVYLLQEEGVGIGNYGFDWYKHGPYSQVLLDDMYVLKGIPSKSINYTKPARELVDRLKKIINDKEAVKIYGMKNWTECLASIHFLKKKVMPSNSSKYEVLRELTCRKPHLNNNNLNEKGYCYIMNLFNGD